MNNESSFRKEQTTVNDKLMESIPCSSQLYAMTMTGPCRSLSVQTFFDAGATQQQCNGCQKYAGVLITSPIQYENEFREARTLD
jgi:hypothetical protein